MSELEPVSKSGSVICKLLWASSVSARILDLVVDSDFFRRNQIFLRCRCLDEESGSMLEVVAVEVSAEFSGEDLATSFLPHDELERAMVEAKEDEALTEFFHFLFPSFEIVLLLF